MIYDIGVSSTATFYNCCTSSTYVSNTIVGNTGTGAWYITVEPCYIYTETEEEKIARLAAEAKREEANAKAETLLKEMFGKEYKALTDEGQLLLNSKKYGNLRYRISKDSWKTIDVLDTEDKIVDRLCVVASIDCPDWDTILTKIMLAKFDEERLQAVANHMR